MVITGYRMKTKDLSEIFGKLEEIKKKISEIADNTYHIILGEEIAFLNDTYSLDSNFKRQPNMTIYEEAINNINTQLELAKRNGSEIYFNFSIYVHLLPYEDYTYIKVSTYNNKFLNAFKELEDCSLTDIECQDKSCEKTKTWNKIHKIYSKTEPAVINLTPVVVADKEKIIFPTKKERVEKQARYAILNHLLHEISCGQQITPVRLMPYLEQVINIADEDYLFAKKTELERKKLNLMQILTELNHDTKHIFEIE